MTEPLPFHEERARRGLPPIEAETCPRHPDVALHPGATHCEPEQTEQQ